MYDFVAIPAITVLCYLFSEAYKAFTEEYKWYRIPVICGALGGMLGVISFLFISGFIPADNVIVAAAIGVVSGLAATGANQILKQNM